MRFLKLGYPQLLNVNRIVLDTPAIEDFPFVETSKRMVSFVQGPSVGSQASARFQGAFEQLSQDSQADLGS